jgi:hypothetical protein
LSQDEQLINLQKVISTVFGNTTLSRCKQKILYSHSRPISGLLVISLASVFVLDHYLLWSENEINAFLEAAYVKDQLGENSVDVYLSYYSSIFSNLSRGLPIDEGVSISEPVNGQEGIPGAVENLNPADQVLQQEQTQESLPSISNNSQ